MNLEERRLITDLFDRMRGVGRVDKDQDAASLIAEELRRQPDAGYMLVQTVLVQEQALARADERIRELEHAPAAPAQAEQRGSFFGGPSVPRTSSRSSVPLTRQSPANRDNDEEPGWSNRGARNAGGGWGGGGFLGTALTTAAGVAGGMMLADSIGGLFNDPASGAAKPTETANQDNGNQNAGNDVQEASHQDDGGGDGWDFGEMDI